MSVCKREHKMVRKAKYVCDYQRSVVTGVSCLTLLEEAGSVKRRGHPVTPVVSQAPAHENLFRRVQYCQLNRYQPTFRPFKPISDLLPQSTSPAALSSLTLSFNKDIKDSSIKAAFI